MPTTRSGRNIQSPSAASASAGAENSHPSNSAGLAGPSSDDDDMDYDQTTDSEAMDAFESLDGDEDEYHDLADDGEEEIAEVLLELAEEEGSGDGESGGATGASGTTERIQLPARFLDLLSRGGFRQLLAQGSMLSTADEDDDDDDEDYEDDDGATFRNTRRSRRRRAKKEPANFPPVPSEEGRKLMSANVFGTNEYYRDVRSKASSKLSRKLMQREMGLNEVRSPKTPSAISQTMLPSSTADQIIHYSDRCYSGQFSDDGNFFFSCAQDFKVRMYDTSSPYNWKYYKTVNYDFGSWTITDASLSRDNKYLAYSSIKNIVCLAPTDPSVNADPLPLDFANVAGRGGRYHSSHMPHFGIWSIRFSGDGREIVAGTSDNSVYVYDIDRQQTILRIPGHSQHVNAVCFGDASSPHILYSGSDDTLIKVWDRRSMSDNRAAGVFVGHTEGLTYVDSKGDGRYVLSNGKDQTMKLWDLRKMMSTEKAATIDHSRYTTEFDYRFMSYADADWRQHPHDCSLVTYRGHSVLKTLIRCHFSPPSSTNSRYVYSGSEDGSVYIYNMDATLAGKIDVKAATHHSRPRDAYTMHRGLAMEGRHSWSTCVRDASWHPHAPIIAATSWNGWGMSTGTCTTHSWNDGAEEDEGFPPMGSRVDAKLRRDESLYGHVSSSGGRSGIRRRDPEDRPGYDAFGED